MIGRLLCRLGFHKLRQVFGRDYDARTRLLTEAHAERCLRCGRVYLVNINQRSV